MERTYFINRDVNGSVPVLVHGGYRLKNIKDKVDSDLDPSRGQFLGSESKTIKEMVKPDL